PDAPSLFGPSIDGDNFEPPIVRYRLQTVNGTTLKIITFPSDSAKRTEVGKNVLEMTWDFSGKHKIVGWREGNDGSVSLYTIDFDNRLFSILKMNSVRSTAPLAHLEVTKCR